MQKKSGKLFSNKLLKNLKLFLKLFVLETNHNMWLFGNKKRIWLILVCAWQKCTRLINTSKTTCNHQSAQKKLVVDLIKLSKQWKIKQFQIRPHCKSVLKIFNLFHRLNRFAKSLKVFQQATPAIQSRIDSSNFIEKFCSQKAEIFSASYSSTETLSNFKFFPKDKKNKLVAKIPIFLASYSRYEILNYFQLFHEANPIKIIQAKKIWIVSGGFLYGIVLRNGIVL